jgi:hypothetical protein
VIRGSFLASALINIGHGWQYQAVEDTSISVATYQAYAVVNGNSFSDYPHANQGWGYLYFSIVYFVLNFVVFFILNTAIEVKLVRRMHKELDDKRERIARMNSDDKMKNEIEDKKKEKKVIKMVIFNGILNFVLRAPDMLFWLENTNIFSIVIAESIIITLFSKTGLASFVPGLLGFVADVGYLSYILTFSTNFIIFYKFNLNFRNAVVFF